MRVALLTLGSRGDVQPFVALGKRLVASGHEVRLATNGSFEAEAQKHGFEFRLVRDYMHDFHQSPAGVQASGRKVARVLLRALASVVEEALDSYLAASIGADVVVAMPTVVLGPAIAAKCGASFYLMNTMPFMPTRELAHPMSALLPLGRTYNWLSWRWNNLESAAHLRWLEVTGARLGSRIQAWAQAHRLGPAGPNLQFAAYSKAIVPLPRDWPANVQQTGFWFLDDESVPPQAAIDFIEAGEPPIAIGFGSMFGGDVSGVTRVVLEALGRVRRRAIVLTGGGGLDADLVRRSGVDAYVARSLPHGWLLPRVAAFVHHGGAGTTGAALRAGIPSVAVPFIADQFFWGKRLSSLGVGLPPLPKRTLRARSLAATLRRLLTDTAIRHRAKQVGIRVRAEDGVGSAARWIESFGPS